MPPASKAAKYEEVPGLDVPVAQQRQQPAALRLHMKRHNLLPRAPLEEGGVQARRCLDPSAGWRALLTGQGHRSDGECSAVPAHEKEAQLSSASPGRQKPRDVLTVHDGPGRDLPRRRAGAHSGWSPGPRCCCCCCCCWSCGPNHRGSWPRGPGCCSGRLCSPRPRRGQRRRRLSPRRPEQERAVGDGRRAARGRALRPPMAPRSEPRAAD
mmetsp:Transcript_116272/g.371059  ORF Transcript_116272/g.371059 Transcript_116272/m.371059 type:complete len:211 (-) Transcript_116272:53-685(-)